MSTANFKNFSDTAIILGSGLNTSLVKSINIEYEINFSELEDFPQSTAPGHVGKFLFCKIASKPVIIMQGRLHYYEGHSIDDITKPIKFLHELGVKNLIVTNASGAINTSYVPGDMMIIEDHINFMGFNPLRGPKYEAYDRFPDMTYTYDKELSEMFRQIAEKHGAKVHSGIYIAVSGPSYETPAEIRAFRTLGADAVGMSTVPEVIMAKQLKMRVLGISTISNMAAGILDKPLSEDEVLEAGRKISSKFRDIIIELMSTVL